MTPDFLIENHFSLCLLVPRNRKARAWVAEHLPEITTFGDGVAVEHRFLGPIVAGIFADGLVAMDANSSLLVGN